MNAVERGPHYSNRQVLEPVVSQLTETFATHPKISATVSLFLFGTVAGVLAAPALATAIENLTIAMQR